MYEVTSKIRFDVWFILRIYCSINMVLNKTRFFLNFALIKIGFTYCCVYIPKHVLFRNGENKQNKQMAKILKVYFFLRKRNMRQFMQTILNHILSIICSKKHPRSIWAKPRNQNFWYETMTSHWDEEDKDKEYENL